VEEEIARVYPTDKIKSPVHLSIGQEAVAVGVCEALRPEDTVFGSYRGHALYLAKGGSLSRMIAELYGKVTGCARGKGGSMHLVDPDASMMGTSAVVASTIPNAVGYAYALKRRRHDSIVVSFFGDGAVEEGVFTESINFAALKSLPILFVCENNGYAIHTPQAHRQAVPNICERVRPYGIPSERVENNDIFKLYDRVSTAVDAMRSTGAGPFFIECMTYRWKEHVGPNDDFALGYRPHEEALPWIEQDTVRQLAALIPTETRQTIDAEVESEIREAFLYAEESEFPELSELYCHVLGDA
jgi:TPP-dependent pyruvate/acetoin dehydrogenase alpha subunit